MRDGTYAVIPVKSFASAKGRLAPILSSAERHSLARFMLEDVIDAVEGACNLAGWCIVTADSDAAAIAESYGGEVVAESGEFGHSPAIHAAIDALESRAGGILVIPADIPHLPSTTIDAVVGVTDDDAVTLVPALHDGGTNLLAVRPCNVFPPLFGPDSFNRHRAAALRRGITPRIFNCPMAGYDLDRPRDLIRFLAMRSWTRAHEFLAQLDIAERLAPTASIISPAVCVEAPA